MPGIYAWAKEKFFAVMEITSQGLSGIVTTLVPYPVRDYLYDVSIQIKSGATHAFNPATSNALRKISDVKNIFQASAFENIFLYLLPAAAFELARQNYHDDEEESNSYFAFNYSPIYLAATYILVCRYLQMQRDNSILYNKAITNTITQKKPNNENFKPCGCGVLASEAADFNSLIDFIGDLAILFGVETAAVFLEKLLKNYALVEDERAFAYNNALFFSTFLMRSLVYGKAFLEYRIASSGEVCAQHRKEKLLKNNWYALAYGGEYVGMGIIFNELCKVMGIGNAYTAAAFSSLAYQYFMAAALMIERLPGRHKSMDVLAVNHAAISKTLELSSGFILTRLKNRQPSINVRQIISSPIFRFASMAIFFEDPYAFDKLVREPAFYSFLNSHKDQIHSTLAQVKPYRKSWTVHIFYWIPTVFLSEKYGNLQKLVSIFLGSTAKDGIKMIEALLQELEKYKQDIPPVVRVNDWQKSLANIDEDFFGEKNNLSSRALCAGSTDNYSKQDSNHDHSDHKKNKGLQLRVVDDYSQGSELEFVLVDPATPKKRLPPRRSEKIDDDWELVDAKQWEKKKKQPISQLSFLNQPELRRRKNTNAPAPQKASPPPRSQSTPKIKPALH